MKKGMGWWAACLEGFLKEQTFHSVLMDEELAHLAVREVGWD